MNYYSSLENIILESKPKIKIQMFKEFYKSFLENKFNFEENHEAYKMEFPSYQDVLKIVLPKNAKHRKYVNTKEGKISLLHTVAHIEYSAIDLALDAALRYKNMPKSFYEDWLEVANDEVRHFLMLEKLLIEAGSYFGELEVHTNLFEAIKLTPDLLSRMAVVPRFLEANGLEQNPKIMDKLNSNADDFNKKILAVLKTILKEEVNHVLKGDIWFKYECERLKLEPEKTYIDILERVYPGSTKRKQSLNMEARKQAGFSCNELKYLSKMDDCK